MTIREQTEEIERKILHPMACLSSKSKGRLKPEKEEEIRT
jgi:dGTPase